MEELMSFDVVIWDDLPEEESERAKWIMANQITKIGETGLQAAVYSGKLTSEEYRKIQSFLEWYEEVGGYDD